MDILPALLDLCEGNPPVTGGFPSHKASNAEFLWAKCWRICSGLKVLTHRSRVTHLCVSNLRYHSPGTGCPIPDVDYLCLLCIDFYVWDAVSTFNHLPRMFLSTDFAFWITDWTCCHGPYLHAILRIISRGVSGLATDSPCGVWGRGWTTCLLYDSPLFGSHFKMRVGM